MLIHTYWLKGEERKRSTTGEMVTLERGPFCVMILGCAHRRLTKEEIEEYVMKTHGQKPTRFKTEEVSK